jgi:hypothetical protein
MKIGAAVQVVPLCHPLRIAEEAATVHRLFVSGSERSCEKWMGDDEIAGIEKLQLHHFYRGDGLRRPVGDFVILFLRVSND